jgi:ISXO2-like transposase domain/Transposase zinc-ribbon domain
MARNPVQFQKGMSRAMFQGRYGREDQCHEELVRLRWPDGFVCPACKGRKYSFYAARRAFQCSLCRLQTSVKAGTLFHKSKLPLSTWFLAIYLVTQSKNDISALELSRQLGVKYDTAWAMKHKLMAAMGERNKTYKLKGSVQIDDAYLGGQRSGGLSGRGAEGKTPFLAAVETRDGKPIFIKLRLVRAFTKDAVESYALETMEAGCAVISDGLSCFSGLAEAGMTHTAVARGKTPRRIVDPRFKWVNIGLGNIKSAITGTCRAIRAQHASRYLAAYEYRYNRRFDLPRMVPALAAIAARTAPKPYKNHLAGTPG